MTTAISFQHVTKDYETSKGIVRALRGLDLEIPQGVIYGLLGPNGAGKTTALEIAVGLREATGGLARTMGLDPVRENAEVRNRISIQPQNATGFDLLTGEELLDIWSALYPNPRPAEELIRLLDMSGYIDRQLRRLSGGQRQRVNLALALIGGVNVTVLDEPSTGLDPMARADLWDALRHLKQEGMTIILSTHDMEEAEVLCDHLAIIDAGAVVAEGSPSELIADAERRHQGPERFRGLTDVFFQAAGRSFHQQNK